MARPVAGPPKLVNLYYARAVGTAKPCYICSKETTVCLATIDVSDFIYTCQSHLSDPGFARPVEPPAPTTPTVAQEEIDRVTKEWQAKQKAKADKGKGKDDSKEDKTEKQTPPPPAPIPVPQATTGATPTGPKKYTLHRDILAMRTDHHRKQYLAKQAKEKGAALPFAPIGFPTLPGASPSASSTKKS